MCLGIYICTADSLLANLPHSIIKSVLVQSYYYTGLPRTIR